MDEYMDGCVEASLVVKKHKGSPKICKGRGKEGKIDRRMDGWMN